MPRTNKKRTRKQEPVDSDDDDDVVCEPVAKKRKMDDDDSKKKIVSLLKDKKGVELRDEDEVNKFVVTLLANGKGFEIVKGKAKNKGRKSTKKCDSKKEAVEAATELLLSKISDESFVLFEPQSEEEESLSAESQSDKADEESDEDDEDDKASKQKTYKTIQMKAKERVPVDEYFGNASGAYHVLQDDDGVIYDAMLNQTNIAQNNNKFYKLQVLRKENSDSYAAFFRWGRVGYEGQTSKTVGKKAKCIAAFCKKFYDKSDNSWEDRDDFVSQKGKYTYLPMDYGADAAQDNDVDDSEESDDDEDEAMVDKDKKQDDTVDTKYKTIQMKAKERVPVDEYFYAKSLLSGVYHVLQDDDGVVYEAMMNQTNIAQNNNKYYKLQVLRKENTQSYAAFFRWGRVGYPGMTSQTVGDKDKCIAAFCKKFHDKSANHWEDRDDFEATRGKYTYLPMDYGDDSKQDNDDDDDESDEEEDVSSKKKEKKKTPDCELPPAVQDLVKLIFDKDMFASQMKEIGYDAAKLPLGKVDKSIISKAYEILKDLEKELNSGSNDNDDEEEKSDDDDDDDDEDGDSKKKKTRRSKRNKKKKQAKSTKSTRRVFREAINDLSSQYYTLIPHEFKFRKPPLLNTEKLLRKEMELVEALSEIEVANRLVSGDKKARVDRHPLDTHFDLLKCDMQHLDNGTSEFECIERYVQSTHASTHNAYSLQVENVFKLDRQGSSERFEPFGKLENRMLLFHGSRLTNFVGIISQGLRIAPPEAPVTGYMFGKGVYFADSSSKSANYCFTTATNNTGLMLLCEVALGKMNELKHSDYYAADLPTGCSSTKGVGKICPDQSTWQTLDNGCVVPSGKHVEDRSFDGSLMYNEYIVYDTKQIKMKYLLKLKFDYTDDDGW